MRMLVPSRIRSVVSPATTESTVSGSSQWPSGPVGCFPPSTAAALRTPVLLEALPEHDVVGHDELVDARLVEQPSPLEHRSPSARIVGCERDECRRDDRRRGPGHGSPEASGAMS